MCTRPMTTATTCHSTGPARAARGCVLLVALLAGPRIAAAAPDAAADIHPPDTLADQAVASNPGLSAINAGIKALQARVQGAGAWMDPMLSLVYMNMPVDRWAPGASPMSGIQLAVKQRFPWPGKTGARQDAARAMVAVQRQSLAERKVQLRAMVKRAYFRLALTRQLRRVTSEHIKLLDQLMDTVRIKYEVGKVGQHDLLRLQVLRGKLTDDLGNFERNEEALTAAINAALHRKLDVLIRTPARIEAPAPGVTVEALVKQAVDSRPALKRYIARAAARRAMARRADREGYPDISAWFAYTIRVEAGMDPGTNFVTLGVAVPLPVLSDQKWDAIKSEAEQQAKQAELAREAELDRIRGAMGRVVAGWKRAAREARTYRETLKPQAHKTLDATLAAYQVDRASFASLFQAEVQLLKFERTIRKAEATAALARVEAEALIGAPVQIPAAQEK